MKIFGIEFGGKSKIEKKSSITQLIIPGNSFIGMALLDGEMSAYTAMKYYRQNSSVATAVDMIADAFEQIKPVLKGPDGKFDTDNEVISLLNQPNGFQAWESFAGQISRHYLITGNTYFIGLGGVKRPPLEVYAAKPQLVSASEDQRDLFPSRYQIYRGVGTGIYTRNESLKNGVRFYRGGLNEIFHTMGFSSSDSNIQGDSLLKSISLEIKQQLQGRLHNLKLIENGGRLSLIVSFKDQERVENDEHQERKKRIKEDLSGSDNAGGIAVVSGADTSITEVGKSNKDMDYAKLENIASNIIYLRYKIPLPLVTTEATSFNNMDTSVGMLFNHAVLPHAKTMFGGLSKFLLPRYGFDPSDYQITYDPLSIPAIKERVLEDIEKRRKINIESPDELRAEIGRGKLSSGGDKVYQAANLVPIGEDLFEDDGIETTPPEE